MALVLLAAVARPGTGVSPFVVQVSALALAGGAAYLLDDAAAPMTTVTPPGVWRRRLRGLAEGATVLAGAWALVLLLLTWQASRPPLIASGELAVLCLGSVAAAAVMFRRGDPQPGARVAPVVLLLGVSLVIAGSMVRLTISLPWDISSSVAVRMAWGVGGLVAALVLGVASRDPAGSSSVLGRLTGNGSDRPAGRQPDSSEGARDREDTRSEPG